MSAHNGKVFSIRLNADKVREREILEYVQSFRQHSDALKHLLYLGLLFLRYFPSGTSVGPAASTLQADASSVPQVNRVSERRIPPTELERELLASMRFK